MQYSAMGFLNYLDTMEIDSAAVQKRCEKITENGVQSASAGYSVANAEAPGVPGGSTTSAIATAADRLHAAFTGFGRQLSTMSQSISAFTNDVDFSDNDGSDALSGGNR